MKQSRCFLAHESPFPVGGGFFGGVISILLPDFWNLKDGSIKMGQYPDLNCFEAFSTISFSVGHQFLGFQVGVTSSTGNICLRLSFLQELCWFVQN